MSFCTRAKKSLLLDLGSDRLKILEIIEENKILQVKDFLIKKLQQPLLKNGGLDFNKSLRLLKFLLDRKRFSVKNIDLIVSGSNVITKILTLPTVKTEELKELIFWEIKCLDFSKVDWVIDYEVLSVSEDQTRVLVVLSHKKLLVEQINLLERAGIKVNNVKVAPLIMNNLLSPELKRDNLAIIDIGAQECELSILNKGQFDFRRVFYVGGEDFTSEIKKRLELTTREAEKIKQSGDFDLAVIAKTLEKLIKKISFSIHYWEQRGESVDQILLTGGTSKLKGLQQILAQRLGIKVDFLLGLSQVEFSSTDYSLHFLKTKLPYLSLLLAAASQEYNLN
ncbi:pilus assembly protein PilM [Halanaerobacter jeridensis]|uniref:Type IV pilus assembly protein PilM n=1 Tax=Halanaerobacter jeridensis TaxID=706427 RepID=A0A938XQ30_9FIRM|nr:pilus assembly protein PilM [Halanaerobacter jeridensis]MBM7555205.1 type IV pilus assembly protein PilM [Halanaerobacter jeridensis]